MPSRKLYRHGSSSKKTDSLYDGLKEKRKTNGDYTIKTIHGNKEEKTQFYIIFSTFFKKRRLLIFKSIMAKNCWPFKENQRNCS